MNSNSKSVPFTKIIENLRDHLKPLSEKMLERFSDINSADMEVLKSAWNEIPARRRIMLMDEMQDMIDSDTLVSFEDVAKFALSDSDPQVRSGAISILGECDDIKLARRFIKMMETDDSAIVRACAADALSKFVDWGEMDLIPIDFKEVIEAHLVSTLNNPKENDDVKLKVLEALGFSSDESIASYIQKAFEKRDPRWVASALVAMGRSGNEQWESNILSKLNDGNEEVMIQAMNGCGFLQIQSAKKTLFHIIRNADQYSDDIFRVAVHNLAVIGGEGVRELLENLLENADTEDEIEFFEAAIGELDLADMMNSEDILDFNLPEVKELEAWLDFTGKKTRPNASGDALIEDDEISEDEDDEDELFDVVDYFDEDEDEDVETDSDDDEEDAGNYEEDDDGTNSTGLIPSGRRRRR